MDTSLVGCCHFFSRERLYVSERFIKDHKPNQSRRYCKKCGIVQVTGLNKGKPLNFYIHYLDQIQKGLERRSNKGVSRHGINPFIEAEKRLIVQKMISSELFTDPDGSTQSNQFQQFINILTTQRNALSEGMIKDILFPE